MMSDLPRIAVGTTQREADGTALLWALMDSLECAGVRVQSFLSRACFPPRDGATAITGLAPRHLDSWLMCEDACRGIFSRGCCSSDLALVEGCLATASSDCTLEGGNLTTLCRWLDLPCLAIVDARLLSGCRLPERPATVDGLLLDGVSDEYEACRLQTLFEALWNVPVLGWLGTVSGLRKLIDAIPVGGRPNLGLCRALGNELARHARLDRIYQIATQRPFRQCGHAQGESETLITARCCSPDRPQALRVAVAYDDALGGYFPDTLDRLEALGASLHEFSPLRDDRLPPMTDVVYLGCGHPESFAAPLAGNDCMMLALKSHLCSGRRIYAECGGLAYLCQQIELPDGERFPMVGALNMTACYHPTAAVPQPTELTLAADTWLGQAPLRWRGYLNPHWTIAPHGAPDACVAEAGHEMDVVHRHHAVGSRMCLDFAAQEDLLDRFFRPHDPAAPSAENRDTRRV